VCCLIKQGIVFVAWRLVKRSDKFAFTFNFINNMKAVRTCISL